MKCFPGQVKQKNRDQTKKQAFHFFPHKQALRQLM